MASTGTQNRGANGGRTVEGCRGDGIIYKLRRVAAPNTQSDLVPMADLYDR